MLVDLIRDVARPDRKRFRKIARHVLLVDRPVGPDDGGLDIPRCSIDPFEAGGTRGSAGAGYDDPVDTPDLGHSPKTGQAVADNLAGRIEATLGKN